MTVERHPPHYTLGEEVASSVIHGVGIVLGIAGLGVLTAFASLYGDAWHIVGCSVFGAALIVLYSTSTLYHSIPLPRVKAVLRTLDHSAIFLLIAGTYTPFLLVNLRGAWGWSLFAVGVVSAVVQGGRRTVCQFGARRGWNGFCGVGRPAPRTRAGADRPRTTTRRHPT